MTQLLEHETGDRRVALVRVSPPGESQCGVLEQDTLSAADLRLTW